MSETPGVILFQRPPLEDIFQALPPLGTSEYLSYLQTAATEDLPAEVLVRAYRELRDSGREEACRATLERLLGEKNGRPEYLKSLLYFAAQRVPSHQHWQEALDLYQDAVALILEALPTEQGQFAERAWASFCRQRLIDAWRRTHGRRGERIEPPRAEPPPSEDAPDPLDRNLEPPPWHGSVGTDKLPWLETFVRRSLDQISDDLIRGVAYDQWLSDEPSPIASKGKATNGRRPLTERYRKSRFQIYRALSSARAYLLAALEAQDEMEIDLEAFSKHLRTPRGQS